MWKRTYLNCVGKISTAKELIGPMVKPIIGNEDKSTAKPIGSVMKFMRIQKTPIKQNTITSKVFLPIIFTVELPAKAITAHAEFAIELMANVLVSISSLHSTSS